MIKKPNELKFDDKKICMIIAGVPGIGKTTLALSAPNPLLVDIENGVSRVEAKYRKDTLVATTFAELESDLKNSDLSEYETIVLDTGGKLLEMLKPVVIAEDAKNGKRDGNLSLQGYGAIKRKFSQFVAFVKGLNKNLVLIFHATEVALHDDITGLRIRIEGSSRDDVWDDIDIGGFMEMIGKKRKIGFSNCERYYAKGTHGIHGEYEIPQLANGSKNDFLTVMFNKIKNDLNAEVEELDKYEKIMKTYVPLINKVSNAEEMNQLFDGVKNEKHVLTSKDELWNLIQEKAAELGIKYESSSKTFV